jgi:hypothetical protein
MGPGPTEVVIGGVGALAAYDEVGVGAEYGGC